MKYAFPSNSNFKNNRIITYKFSKTLGQMNFSYNLTLQKFYKDSNRKPACNCEQFLLFVNPTYENIIKVDLAIIKKLNLQRIIKRGAKFCLSNYLKPSNFLSGLNNDLDLFIGKWFKKGRKLIKIVYRI